MLTLKELDSRIELTRRGEPALADWEVTIEPMIDGTFRLAATRGATTVHIANVNILRRAAT